jgi:ketosteroid isomerase-like protein
MLAAQEQDQVIHEELRGVLNGIEEAVNAEEYGELAQYFHENLLITTINQEVISTRSEIEPYFDRWFGPGGYLKTLRMSLVADDLTEFYADKNIGIVRGSGDEDYVLSDTRFFPMKTRWTATVIKDTDGKWRILTLHIGTNFLDNPILTVAENSAKYFGAGGAGAGLLLGLLIGFVWKRRKQAA